MVEIAVTHRAVDAGPDIDGADACRAIAVTKVHGRRDTAVRALRDVTLRISAGAFTAIMGPSGSGKSTLLHCLAALDTPTAGRIFLGGTELTALSRRQQAQVRRDRIGFVFQAFNLVPTLSTLENITLPQRLAGRRPDRDWLDHVVTRVGLGDRLRHRPSELSGGQQQRVALARALAGRPEVIFADEPTGNLDTAASREMLTLLRDAVDRFGQTVVTVTHDPTVSDAADHVVRLTDGQVAERVNRARVDDDGRARQPGGGDGGGRTNTDATLEPDGSDTMRSRRRRRSDETTPGRPMVGSDDEIEVARQERWLQRIREQFEVEHDDAAWATTSHLHEQDPTAPGGTDHAHEAPHERDHDSWTHTREPGHDTWTRAHGSVDDGGWLPAERAGAHPGGETDDRQRPGRDRARAAPDTVPGAPAAEAVVRAEHHDPEPPAVPDVSRPRTPWSRPDPHDAEEPAAGRPPTASPWTHDDDPWAPADRHLADRYRDGTGQFRRVREWATDQQTADAPARPRLDDHTTAAHPDTPAIDDHDDDAHPRTGATDESAGHRRSADPPAAGTTAPPHTDHPAPRPRADHPAPRPADADALRHDDVDPLHSDPQAPPLHSAFPDRAPAVPPPLASLRSTRRPDEADPMLALQSLQDQLERLGAGRRRTRRPDVTTPGPPGRSGQR